MAARSNGRRDDRSKPSKGSKASSQSQRSNTVWTAVALQQTLARDLGLAIPAAAASTGTGAAHAQPLAPRSRPAQRQQQRQRRDENISAATSSGRPLARTSGEHLAPSRTNTCTRGTQASASSQATSAGRSANKRAKEERKEKVLVSRAKQLTLAQELGLAPPPEPVLSETQWTKVKKQSSVRGDSDQPCPICHDHYSAARQQVILSCSHTFHLACLEACETFTSSRRQSVDQWLQTGPAQPPCCPICRCHDYEKRLIFDGERNHETHCAVRVQAWWRGHVTRKHFKQLLLSAPEPTDPLLRRRHIERQIDHMTSVAVEEEQQQSAAVDDLMCDVNTALAESRRIMQQANLVLAGKSADESVAMSTKTDTKTHTLWHRASELALGRYDNESECTVCMTVLPELPSAAAMATSSSHGNVDVFLLSCSHVFHSECLLSMERYCCSSVLRCPVCRSTYLRIPWNLVPRF